jgi:hypothetical protein
MLSSAIFAFFPLRLEFKANVLINLVIWRLIFYYQCYEMGNKNDLTVIVAVTNVISM